MATSRSSISNARAPTHRVTARPASSSLKTHRRSLLCRAEDTQTSGTFSFIMCCFIRYCVFFYAQLVFVLFLFLFCFVFLLGFVLLFVVRSSSRSCKVHPSNNNNNQADNPFFLTHTHTHTFHCYLSSTHTHTHIHTSALLCFSPLSFLFTVFVAANVVTDATFEELVLKSPVPVLVDFWAPWCGPCRMIAPLIDEISNEYGDKLRALKLNTDESPSVATEYGIRSIPTVMIFKDGAKLDTVIGAVPKSTLVNAIEKYL